jgi:hypothetical protein
MTTRSASFLAILVFLGLGRAAWAGEACDKSLGDTLRCTRCAAMPCCCPDDYCRKPLPCIPCPVPTGCVDDYCCKPLPCIPCPVPTGCVDDYCRKPLPHFCWPVNCQFYRCPPPSRTP